VTASADFDLHGFVGVRLVDAGPRELRAVARQLGPIHAPLDREPDLLVRFVERLETPALLRTLDQGDVAFTEDEFLVLHGPHGTPARVSIPFERVGGRCEIVCQRGAAGVPLLLPIVHTTALAKGALPLHASAFDFQGTGVVATGWSKGGKTETLLAFMANGARYVGDEWVYLGEAGGRMFGIPEPIRVRDWHLDQMPRHRARLGRGARLRLAALRGLVGAASRVAAGSSRRRSAPARWLGRALPRLRKQLHLDCPPAELFGEPALALRGTPHVIVFVSCHESPEIVVDRADPAEVAQRMVLSFEEKQRDFASYYRKFRFAFPERRNERIEEAAAVLRQLLPQALSGKPAWEVRHPYPVAFPALFEAIRALL
jgi:hypothetical protein